MIETALISGREDRAFVYEGGVWFSLLPDGRVPVAQSVVRGTVVTTGEYEMLKQVSEVDVWAALEGQRKRADGLFTTLAVLDEQLSISTRVLMAEQAEILLQDAGIKSFVEDRILSRPLPSEVVVNRHSLMQLAKNFDMLCRTLREIFDLQPQVLAVENLFLQSAESASLSEDFVSILRSQLMDSGFSVAILRAVVAKDSHKMNSLIVGRLLQRDISSKERSFFLEFQRKTQTFGFSSRSQRSNNKRLFKRRDEDIHLSRVPDPFRPEIGTSFTSHVQHPKLSALKAKERVDRQISQIKELLHYGKLPLAERFIKELMAFQLERDDQEYAVMSLCNLSSAALEANQINFAEALVEYAMELGPTDIVSFTQRAQVYQTRGNFKAALEMYDAVISRFSDQSTYALNGKANVLLEMGRFKEAAELFRSVQTDFPEHPVAFNGEVGLLHRTGAHRAALRLAIENTKRFPLDSVTRAVLAGALSRNGRYQDAVRHYRQAWELDRTNFRAVNGVAFAMRSSGRASEALRHLNAYLTDNPGFIPILNTKAIILRGLKKFAEAREVYNTIIQIFPEFVPAKYGLMALDIVQHLESLGGVAPEIEQLESEIDWVGFRTVMIALIKIGKSEIATKKITQALPMCPWSNQRIRLKTVLGLAELESDNANCIRTLQENIEQLDDRQKQARLIFLSHAQMEQNNPTVGRMLAANIVNTKDRELDVIRQQVLKFDRSSQTFRNELISNELEFALAA